MLTSPHFGIPRGAKHIYWSQRFLALMAEAPLQAIYANELAYPGLNLDAIKYVKPEVAPHLVTYPEHLAKQFFIDLDWWTEHGLVAQERWNRWMLIK